MSGEIVRLMASSHCFRLREVENLRRAKEVTKEKIFVEAHSRYSIINVP